MFRVVRYTTALRHYDYEYCRANTALRLVDILLASAATIIVYGISIQKCLFTIYLYNLFIRVGLPILDLFRRHTYTIFEKKYKLLLHNIIILYYYIRF